MVIITLAMRLGWLSEPLNECLTQAREEAPYLPAEGWDPETIQAAERFGLLWAELQALLKARDILDLGVDEIGLSTRASNALMVARINTLRDLVSQNPYQLTMVKNFRKGGLAQARKVVRSLGLTLGMQLPKT